MKKVEVFADATVKIDDIKRYVSQYTPSISQQGILSKHYLSEAPTELRYFARSSLLKEVHNRNLLIFKLASPDSMDVSIWIFSRFQQRNRQNSQNLINDVFLRLPAPSAQCIVGAGTYPDACIILIHVDIDYS